MVAVCSLSCVWLLQPHGQQPARLLCPWDFPGKNTGAGSHFLPKQIFLTQGPNLGLLHCRQILYRLSYERSLKTTLLSNYRKWCHHGFSKWVKSTPHPADGGVGRCGCPIQAPVNFHIGQKVEFSLHPQKDISKPSTYVHAVHLHLRSSGQGTSTGDTATVRGPHLAQLNFKSLWLT